MKDDELSSDTLVPQDRHCNCSPSNDPKQVLQYLCNTIGDDVACEKKKSFNFCTLFKQFAFRLSGQTNFKQITKGLISYFMTVYISHDDQKAFCNSY